MSVINVRKAVLKKRGIADLLEWSSRADTLYIGRAMPYVPGATVASRWANPFSVERHGRERCLELFEARIRDNYDGLWDALEELDGKELGCWCCPEPCHGDVLVRLLDEKKQDRDRLDGLSFRMARHDTAWHGMAANVDRDLSNPGWDVTPS
jgi:hypothetical protein